MAKRDLLSKVNNAGPRPVLESPSPSAPPTPASSVSTTGTNLASTLLHNPGYLAHMNTLLGQFQQQLGYGFNHYQTGAANASAPAHGMGNIWVPAATASTASPHGVAAGNGSGPGSGLGSGAAEANYLVLILHDNLVDREVYYKIRPTTKLGRLMRFHCQMMGQTLAWTRFVAVEKGVHLNQTDTAAEMGIMDGDHIRVVFHSCSIVSQGP